MEKERKRYYSVPVVYEMYGSITVEAGSAEEAYDRVKNHPEEFSLPDEGFYVDDSFRVADDDRENAIETIKMLNSECCDWKRFSALVYIEGSADKLPTYTIEGVFEEGEPIGLEDARDGFIRLRITHHSEDLCFPSALTPDPDQGVVNFFGVAEINESRLPDEILKAIKAGKRLMVSYDYDSEVDDGVGPGGHLFPVWSDL